MLHNVIGCFSFFLLPLHQPREGTVYDKVTNLAMVKAMAHCIAHTSNICLSANQEELLYEHHKNVHIHQSSFHHCNTLKHITTHFSFT